MQITERGSTSPNRVEMTLKDGHQTLLLGMSSLVPRRCVDFGQGPDDFISTTVEMRSSGPWPETEINTASGDEAKG